MRGMVCSAVLFVAIAVCGSETASAQSWGGPGCACSPSMSYGGPAYATPTYYAGPSYAPPAYGSNGNCPWWRPCGPGSTYGGNRGIPQGFYGADFRPACANHDACLASGMYSRRECDRMFLGNMQNSCQYSDNPEACMRKARHYYAATRMFGWMY